MCIRYNSSYLCNCEGKPQIYRCRKSHAKDVPCSISSFDSHRAFCCSMTCCNKALTFAQDRHSEALAQREAWKPSLFAWLWDRATLRGKEEQLEKRLASARQYLDWVEETHRMCYAVQKQRRDKSRQPQEESEVGDPKDASELVTVPEEDEEWEEVNLHGETVEREPCSSRKPRL